MKNELKIDVVFLLERDEPHDVFAYFPHETADPNGNKLCYAHVGQHSACSEEYAQECQLATEEQYSDLKHELDSRGYNLNVLDALPGMTNESADNGELDRDIEIFANMLQSKIDKYYENNGRINYEVKVKPGQKYVKIDIADNGRFMVDNTDGRLYAIKAYGVINKKKCFGSVAGIIAADFDYDGYSIAQKGKTSGPYGYGGKIAERLVLSLSEYRCVLEKKSNELTQEQVDKVVEYLKKDNNGVAEFYWDYNSELSDKEKSRIVKGDFNYVENEIYDLNVDYVWDMEVQTIKDALKACDIDANEYDDNYLRDKFLDYVTVDMNIKDLLRNEYANVRLTLYSNYDCINSHYFETSGNGGYEYKESYFGAVVDALNINPTKMKKMLNDHGINTFGTWPNKSARDGKEYVGLDAFWQEEVNRSCGACLLVAVAKISLLDFIDMPTDENGKTIIKTITIPKGNYVGFYSSMQGGGSTIEMPLLRDLTVDLTKHGATKYDCWGIETDSKENGYTIDDAYGVTDKFWGKEAIIK